MLVTKHDWSVKKSPGCAHVQVRIQMNQCTYQTENQDLNHTSKMRFPTLGEESKAFAWQHMLQGKC